MIENRTNHKTVAFLQHQYMTVLYHILSTTTCLIGFFMSKNVQAELTLQYVVGFMFEYHVKVTSPVQSFILVPTDPPFTMSDP
jgi:hypothetical protein